MLTLRVEELPGGARRVALTGTMDIEGTQSIELQLNAHTASQKALIALDLSGVDFMASIGIGVIVQCHRAVRRRGGNLVILGPRPVVALVLTKTQIDRVVPTVTSLQEALDILAAPPAAPAT